jgi:hypothetical protein
MRKPSPATAIACVALFFALTGVGLAAGRYIITSPKQIKPSVLREIQSQAHEVRRAHAVCKALNAQRGHKVFLGKTAVMAPWPVTLRRRAARAAAKAFGVA